MRGFICVTSMLMDCVGLSDIFNDHKSYFSSEVEHISWWVGWHIKFIYDHLEFKIKVQLPYIFHKKANNPFVNLEKEYKGDEIMPTF